jgi:hypothetical protein
MSDYLDQQRKARAESTFVVDQFYKGRWATIGIYVFGDLKSARRTMEYYLAKEPNYEYRIVETVRVRQPPVVVEVVPLEQAS